jgi:O-antigen ligase
MTKRNILTITALASAIPWIIPVTFFGPAPAVIQFILSAYMALLVLALLLPLQRGRAHAIGAKALAWGLVIAAVLNSLIALGQVTGWSNGFEPWIANADATGLGFGNLRQRNHFASLCVLGFAALVFLVRSAPNRGGIKVLAILALMVLMVGNASTASRTGFIGMLLVVLMNLGWKNINSNSFADVLNFLSLPILTFMSWSMNALGLVNTNALNRFSQGDELCSSRLTLWSNVIDLIIDRPWTGWGWGELAYAHFVTLYSGPKFCAILDNAHNFPLHLAVTLGIPVSLLVCGFLIIWIVQKKPWIRPHSSQQLAWCLLAVIALHSMLEYPLWYGIFLYVTTASILLISSSKLTNENKEASFNSIKNKKIEYLLLISFAAITYLTWDYHRISQAFLPPEFRSKIYKENLSRKINGSFIFQKQVLLATLTSNLVTVANAREINDLAKILLHSYPEEAVIAKIIESATILGENEDAAFYSQRLQASGLPTTSHRDTKIVRP